MGKKKKLNFEFFLGSDFHSRLEWSVTNAPCVV